MFDFLNSTTFLVCFTVFNAVAFVVAVSITNYIFDKDEKSPKKPHKIHKTKKA